MMDWCLQEQPGADAYIDDVIVGAGKDTEEKSLRVCYERARKVLQRSAELQLVFKGDKCKFFQRKVEFCGHVLTEGKRSPAPGKLLPIQLWELPDTVTALRGFLGLTNYFSEYVHHYAEVAAPLMAKLRLNRQDGKKGSKLKLLWTDEEKKAFVELKNRLADHLELWQADPDRPFRLRCDASDYAIGAELVQEIGGVWRTVGLYSRKLGGSQLNWTIREKETYSIVAALQKWANTIGFQPVEVTTDHKSLENWVTEHVNTPSGPRGRRARWHEALSQFDLSVVYIPGPENVVADSMSRWAYPASSAREDVSFHGSAAASAEVAKMLEDERRIAIKVEETMQKTRDAEHKCKEVVAEDESLKERNWATVQSIHKMKGEIAQVVQPVTLRSGRQARQDDEEEEQPNPPETRAARRRRMTSPPPPVEPAPSPPLRFEWAIPRHLRKEKERVLTEVEEEDPIEGPLPGEEADELGAEQSQQEPLPGG